MNFYFNSAAPLQRQPQFFDNQYYVYNGYPLGSTHYTKLIVKAKSFISGGISCFYFFLFVLQHNYGYRDYSTRARARRQLTRSSVRSTS